VLSAASVVRQTVMRTQGQLSAHQGALKMEDRNMQ